MTADSYSPGPAKRLPATAIRHTRTVRLTPLGAAAVAALRVRRPELFHADQYRPATTTAQNGGGS